MSYYILCVIVIQTFIFGVAAGMIIDYIMKERRGE